MASQVRVFPDFLRTVLTPASERLAVGGAEVDFVGDLEVVEVAEELNEVAKLKESSTFDADIPYSFFNKWLVSSYGNKIPILAYAHGLQLPETLLVVNGHSESAGQYDVSFVRDQEWPEYLKNLSLNDLEGFEPFQLGEEFLADNQANDASYDGLTRGFWTPVAYYGGLNRFNDGASKFELMYADFRLWFHFGKLLKEIFSKAGYAVDCPFLETEYGKRLIAYWCGGKVYDGFAAFDPNPGDDIPPTFSDKFQLPANKSQYKFRASNTSPQTVTGISDPQWQDSEAVVFDDDTTGGNYDNGAGVDEGFFDTTVPAIQGFSGKWHYHIRLRVAGNASPTLATMGFFANTTSGPVPIIETKFLDAAGNNIGLEFMTLDVPGGSVTADFDIYATVESVLAFRDIVFGFAFGEGIGLVVEEGSWIEGSGEFIIVTEQILPTNQPDVVNETVVFPQSWLSDTAKAIEVLEGFCHLFNAKVYTDRARRVVGIYTERDVAAYGESSEPYYFDTVEQDLTGIQREQSITVDTKESLAPNTLILGFKETTDEHIGIVSKGQPFDATVNLDGIAPNIERGKVEENRNAWIEPTLDRPFVEVRVNNPNSHPISVPVLWDNSSGECSVKIAPRVLYAYGLVKQKQPNTIVYKRYTVCVDGKPVSREVFPYATQFSSEELVDASNVAVDSDKTVVYDHDRAVSEPLLRYWSRRVRAQFLAKSVKLTILPRSFNQFLMLSFRSLFSIRFEGRIWKGRLSLKRTRVNDFSRAEIELTEEID